MYANKSSLIKESPAAMFMKLIDLTQSHSALTVSVDISRRISCFLTLLHPAMYPVDSGKLVKKISN